jgi:hypothetical protein
MTAGLKLDNPKLLPIITRTRRSVDQIPVSIQSFWSTKRTDTALALILLGLLCARVWDIGITHTDDAFWALGAQLSPQKIAELGLWDGQNPVYSWATRQGRLWAFVSGTLLLHTLKWQGTVYGEMLRLGSFIVFFFVFHIFAAVYCGRRIAMMSVCLFLAFFVERWSGSLLTGSPLTCWPSCILFFLAVLAAQQFFVRGKVPLLVIAGLCLFVSLLNYNEGVALLLCILFPVTIVSNSALTVSGNGAALRQILRASRTRTLLAVYVTTVAIYSALTFAWAVLHPSHYEGHVLAPFDFVKLATVAVNFATSNSILHDLVRPYGFPYADAIAGSGLYLTYNPTDFAPTLVWYPMAIISGTIAAAVFQRTLLAQCSFRSRASRLALPELFAIVVGLTIACVPIIPVAASKKYQDWFFELGITSYSHSILAYFGLSLFLAGLVSLVFRKKLIDTRFGKALAIAVTIAVGLFAAIAFRMDDSLVIDMRPEAGRWRVLGQAIETIKTVPMNVKTIWAPRFKVGSIFNVVQTWYWSDYTEAKYQIDIQFVDTLTSVDLSRGAAVLDYSLADDKRNFICIITHLKPQLDSEQRVIADSIAINIERATDHLLMSYFLSFLDAEGVLRQVRLVDLPKAGGPRLLVLKNVLAEPSSVRVIRVPELSRLPYQRSSPASPEQ